MDIYCTLHLWDYNYNERHICDAILILNEVSKQAHVLAPRSQFDGSNSKWTNHTWASRMKLYCFVIKNLTLLEATALHGNEAFLRNPLKMKLSGKLTDFFLMHIEVNCKEARTAGWSFFYLFLQPFWSYWRWTLFCFIVERYCHISSDFFWKLWRIYPFCPF